MTHTKAVSNSPSKRDTPPSVNPIEVQRLERARDVLVEVIDLSPSERAARLEQLVGSDPPLRAAIEELLTYSDAADRDGFLSAMDVTDVITKPPGEFALEQVGPYRITGQIGEGGASVVYLAESPPPLLRKVAIKIIRASGNTLASSRAAIEVEALASMNHLGIAQIYETGLLNDGRRWIACEWIDGEPIGAITASLDWRQIVELLIQAAEAVHHAHQRGVVHRDLKPSNMLVTRNAGDISVKVIDFGVARLLHTPGDLANLTEPGLLVGTLAYMSPEQLTGRAVDARTDVYGIGLVAAELLTCKPVPGRAGGLSELTAAAESHVRVRLTGCGGHERDLEAVIASATQPNPDSRYASMQHLADDLRRVLTNEPILARRPGAWWRMRLYASRHPVLSSVTLLASLIITLLIAALSISLENLASEVHSQKQLISDLTNDTLIGLREIRGTHTQRERMVNTLLERHARRLASDPKDPELRSLQARLLRERGDLSAQLGRLDDALADLRSSREVYDQLVAEDFGGSDIARLSAESIIRIGDLILERDRAGGVPAAMTAYRDAMASQEVALRANPENITLLDDLCWSYDRIGDLGDKWGTMPDPELELWLQERIRRSEALLAIDPTRPLSRYNLATGYYRLARFLGIRERNEESAAAVAAGLPHIRAIVQAEPHRTVFVQMLIGMLSWETTTLLRRDRLDTVPAVVSEMVDIARAHARLLPGDIMAEEALINAITQAAGTMSDIGRRDEARAYATESLERLQAFRTTVSPSRLPELDENEAFLRALILKEN